MDSIDKKSSITAIAKTGEILVEPDMSGASVAGSAASFRKFAAVAIAGEPNAGKSTLLNRLIGEELVIATHKVQTTRSATQAALLLGETQLVFIDTPGLFQPRRDHQLERYIVKNAVNSIKQADILLFLVDVMAIGRLFRQETEFLKAAGGDGALQEMPQSPELREFVDLNRTIMKQIRGRASAFIFVINKCDLRSDLLPVEVGVVDAVDIAPAAEGAILEAAENLKAKDTENNQPHDGANEILDLAALSTILGYIKKDYNAVCPISASTGQGIAKLLDLLQSFSQTGEWQFAHDYYTDITDQQIAEELTREQIYLQLRKELPYSICVETESWQEDKERGRLIIHQVVVVLKDSQKNIVVGSGGMQIKEIGIRARERMAAAFGKEVELRLFVKARPDWIKRLASSG